MLKKLIEDKKYDKKGRSIRIRIETDYDIELLGEILG